MKKSRLLLFFTLFSFLFIFFTSFSKYDCFSQGETPVGNFPDKEILVYPSGQSCGIKIISDGILVLSVTDINDNPSPAKMAGIRPGDFIKKVNREELKNSKDFINKVKELKSQEFEIEYERDGKILKTKLTPLNLNNEYVLGMWVRDSVAGLGTLTFYTLDKQKFAALGHSIADIDTGETMPVKNGELVFSKIVSLKKGEQGTPGGLTGIFLEDSKEIGTIYENSSFGIYGNLSEKEIVPDIDPVPIGLKKEVSLGKAEIISTIENDTPQKFEVEIIKINKQEKPDIKGMVIKITDKELLQKTGGIIQGMSGSPIIQNGKLVGAVTHVFINDPTKGYGIFIENMIEKTK